MVFKFHIWHDQTTGLLEEKNQSGRESKMAASAKYCKSNEISFSLERLSIFGWNFAWIIFGTLVFKNMKMKKKQQLQLCMARTGYADQWKPDYRVVTNEKPRN